MHFVDTVGTSAGIESHRTLREELQQWDLEEIAEIFVKEKVTLKIMWDFNDEELEELGVGLVQRKKYSYAKDHLKTQSVEKVSLRSQIVLYTWDQRSLRIYRKKFYHLEIYIFKDHRSHLFHILRS